MRFEHDGMSLWYETADAPAPEGAIQTGSDITITIGVQPTYASNKVDVFYRINQGPIETIAAKWLRHDLSYKAQYFKVRLPTFQVGDSVEYTTICRCAGRQVPSPEQAKQFVSSFHIVAAESKPVAGSTIKETSTLKADGTGDYNTGATSPARTVSQPIIPPPESSPGPTKDHSLPQNEAQKTALKSLLSTSPVLADAKLQDTFINLYAQHQGPIQNFWSKLREQPEFKVPGTVENVQFTLQLDALTQNNPPLIQVLQGLRQQGNLQSVRDLTRLDADSWTKLINSPNKGISVPANIAGETQEEKVANYVSIIIGSLQVAFPTAYIAQATAKQPEIDLKLVKSVLTQNPSINPFHTTATNFKMTGISAADQEKAKVSLEALHREVRMFPGLDNKTLLSTNAASSFQNPLRQALSQFFANASDFDFRDTHIDSYITQNAAALKGIDEKYKEAVPTQLKLMQRIFQVTPRYEAMSVLLGEGIHSAYRIARIPQTSFVGRFQDKLGGEEQARAIHTRANSITAMTTTLYSQYAMAFNNVNPAAFGNVNDMFSMIPNYTQLFGSLNLCDCEHCHSVYSPAAYFVDLLQFLDNIGPSDYFPQTALDVLTRRRADLKYIRLNCVNTETPMPYIDLVNEILESYVRFRNTLPNVPGTALPNPKDTSSSATAEELSVNPENTDDLAYKPLQDAVYPQLLPFNRPLEVVRAYLEYLGSSRYEVMSTYKNSGIPSDLAIDSEYLKISLDEYKIFTGEDFSGNNISTPHALWEFYGYISDIVNGNNWKDDVSNVLVFLQRTGLSYLDLIELVKMRLINPNQDLQFPQLIVLSAASEDCDLAKTTIQHLDGSMLDDSTLQQMHRFIRLWRSLGWQMREVDKTMTALKVTDTTGNFLQNLARIAQLLTSLNLHVIQLLSFWANIDTDGDDSLYIKLFQNKAVLNPLDPAFALNSDRSELLNPTAKISDHVPAILAALRINSADLAVLTTTVVTDDTLNLANLSMLYRHAILARTLNLPIKDLVSFKTLTGVNPFTDSNNLSLAGSPATTMAFLEKVRKVRQSSFSVAQLNYLYRHLYDPKRGIAPLQGNVDLLMKSLQAGLKKIAGDTVVMPDPSGDILRQKLAIVLDSKLVNAAMTLIDGSAIYTTFLANSPPTFPASVKDKISYDGHNKKLLYTGNMTSADHTLLKPLGDMSYQNAIDDLFQQPRTFFAKNLTIFLDPKDASSHLLEDQPLPKETQPPAKEERINYALTALLAYLRTSLSQSLVKQLLSEALKLDTAMIDALLGSLLNVGAPLILKSRTNASQCAMADFLGLLDGGLSVTYFANKNLDSTTGTSVTRIDPAINFSWDTASPDPAIPGNTFSASWTGRMLAQNSETYTFTTHTNNGVRLWVNNQLLIDDWHDQPATDHSATIALKAGQLYNITMEYYNDSAGAVAQLWWSSPSISKTIIPQAQFYPGSTFAAFSLLHKVALLANGFKMTIPEAIYLSAHGTDIPGFDFNALPLGPSGFSVSLFDQWEQLYDLFTLRNNLPRGEVGLIDVFEATSLQELKTMLSAATSWDSGVINDLTGSGGFNLTTIDQFKKIEMLTQLYACITLGKHLGISVAQLFSWTKNEPDAAQAQEVKNTVKAKFDDAQWLTVGKTLNDKLRDSQKAALIAYILQMPDIKNVGITDSSRLYEFFLIDVDMTSCMMTSRIKQAICSVQLFIQRCLLNEEPDVDVTLIDIDLWSWMKHYRVWEANRKVFLYPENWIEPELRDNKSPFFKELETELLQKDITPDNVEQALLNYLEKLDEVSRLEICGMYWECETLPDRNILHVFGRTFTIPHVYYYRQLIDATTWTAWEKVNVNIEGDHLIPIVWNRRLHIFWPIFTEKSDDAEIPDPSIETSNNKTTLKTNASPPKKHWEIKIAWSEYKQNKWTPKRVSTDTEVIQVPEPGKYYLSDPKPFFVFKALIDQWTGDLTIRAYLYNKHIGTPGFYIVGEFHLTGCRSRVDILPFDAIKVVEYNLVTPVNCEVASMTFQVDNFAKGLANPFTLITGYFGNDESVNQFTEQMPLTTLGLTQFPYNLLYPHQFLQFAVQAPFFFQDSQRTYFVTPEWDKPVQIFITRLDNNSLNSRSLIPDKGEPAIFGIGTSTVGAGMKVGASFTKELDVMDPIAQVTTARVPKVSASSTRNPVIVDSTAQAMVAESLRAVTMAPSSLETCGITTQTSCDAWCKPQPDMIVSKVKFAIHYHPYVCAFIKALNHYGISGILNLSMQEYGITGATLDFTSHYYPDPTDVDTDYPKQNVDFSPEGAYSLYNWELFFHIPLFIATKLSKNQQFEEAQQWFHYIFNPTDSSLDSWPKRLWRFFPFYNNTDNDKIQDLLALLDYKGDDLNKLKRRCEMIQQVQDWQHHPFDPHRIARLRMIAYQKNVFMKYLDNLIAWGDQLFRQDTIETINEATQLYILAYELLGPRPENIPPRGVIEDKAYVDLQADLDAFSNALVNLENHFPFSTTPSDTGSAGASGGLGIGTTFYFCIPKNDQLLGYWDIVTDRLFKIRHCMNIEGVVQQLPLFEPPIDPALLVQATAMGIDLNSALNDINAATPYYRFNYILQKALELCSEVRALGAALLSALEKKDAEALAAIRAGQETAILKAVRQVKEQQVTEAQTSLEALNKTREVTNIRFMFYHTIEARTAFEKGQIVELTQAQIFQEIGQQHELGASIAHLIPNFDLGVSGFGGSPMATAIFGGANVAGALEAIGRQFGSISSMHTFMANMASILGGWDRRAQEWSLQENLAAKELEQIDKQIAAANIRIAIAQLELDNHDKQIENAQAIEDFLHDKYTNQDLYDWMVGQVSTVYKQCYQMAYDLAKRTEKAFRFERGLTTSNYITFGYWDSLKKGLLSGEQLYLDLKRMEMAYLDQNKREYEITKHISLVLFDPMALITLKECGTCLVNLPEALFDMDYPGHYMRRIKSVSLTIPCVAGPYTSINCTLTLLSNQIRKNADLPGDSDPYSGPKDDADALARFITTFGSVESIATSTAQNDSGMFEVNFRDERYLPFEGAGVVSTWRIDMPKDCNAFDFETISDVIIRLNYTAREGGKRLCEEAKKVALLPTPITQGITTNDTHFPAQPNLTRMFSAKHEFSSDWYRFLHPADITKDQQVLSLGLTQERFPFQLRSRQIDINSIKVFLKLNDKVFYNDDLIFVLREEDITDSSQFTDYPGTFKAAESPICQLPYAELFKDQAETIGKWKWSIVVASTDVSNLQSDPANPPSPSLKQTVKVNGKDYVRLNADAIADIWIVCDYTAKMTIS